MGGGLLPEAERLIIDEAHHLEGCIRPAGQPSRHGCLQAALQALGINKA